jgi:hypothetical protein
VPQEWEVQRLTVDLAYATRNHLPAKVRCFVEFPVEKFATKTTSTRAPVLAAAHIASTLPWPDAA